MLVAGQLRRGVVRTAVNDRILEFRDPAQVFQVGNPLGAEVVDGLLNQLREFLVESRVLLQPL
ncbi:hypothetical protein D3C72_2589550 [compost metagenome]